MKFRYVLLFLEGVLMSQSLSSIEVKGVKIPVIFEKDSHLPIVSLQIVVQNSGSIKDGKKPGLVRFTASMLNEGNKKLGSLKCANMLDQRAINLNVNCGTQTLVYDLSSLKEQFLFGVSMLKDLIADPNFTKSSFTKVKSEFLGKISAKKTDFDYIANVNLKKLLYDGTPLENPTLGDEKSINKITLSDIIVAGGDIQKDELVKAIKPILQSLSVGEKKDLKFYATSDKEKEKLVKKATDQAYIYFGAPFFMKSGDKDIYKSKVASFILGQSGFGSRLMEEVRVKKGLAYSVYSSVSISKSHSSFHGYLQTKTSTLDEAKATVKKVIFDFVKNGVTKDELEQAKKFILGSEPLRNETLSQRLNRAFFEYYNGYKLGHSKKVLDEIEKLSLKDLNDFIKKHKEIEKLSFSIVTK